MASPDEELPPGYQDVLTRLRKPVRIPEEVRSRHLEVALASVSPSAVPIHRRRRAGVLAAAAAIILTVGVVGTWSLAQPTGRNSTTESVAANAPSTRAGTGGARDEALDKTDAADAAAAPAETAPQLTDLGRFDDDDAVRVAASWLTDLAIGSAPTSTVAAGVESASTVATPTPTLPLCPEPPNVSWKATATVADAPVLVGSNPAGDVVVVDRTTCTVR